MQAWPLLYQNVLFNDIQGFVFSFVFRAEVGSHNQTDAFALSSISAQLPKCLFFHQVFDILLLELEPVCTAEQEFVQKFFDFTLDEPEVRASCL